MRTRSGSRTRNLRTLNAAPLPVGYPGLRASGRARTGSARLRVACTTRRAALALLGAGSRSRTGRVPMTSRALPRGSLAGVRALGGSRTRTERLLGTAPLPVGLRGHGAGGPDSNRHLSVASRALVHLELPPPLPRQDSNLNLRGQNPVSLPIRRRGNGAGRRSGQPGHARAADAQVGVPGSNRSRIPACLGVRSALRWLHE